MSASPHHPPCAGTPPLALVTAGIATIALLIAAPALGFRFAFAALSPIAALIAILGAVHLFYRLRRPEPRFASLTGAVALFLWVGLIDGFLAQVGLALDRPLNDTLFAEASRAIGLDHLRVIDWIVRSPLLVSTLDVAYLATMPILLIGLLRLALLGRAKRLNEFMEQWSLLLTVTVAIATLFPAAGALLWQAPSDEVTQRLPPLAGVFHREIFEALRSRVDLVIDPARLEGVLVFPSFHTIMACMIIHAFADSRVLRPLAIGFAVTVFVSTIPIGGHHAVDVFAGGLLFVAFRLLQGLRDGFGRSLLGRTMPRDGAASSEREAPPMAVAYHGILRGSA